VQGVTSPLTSAAPSNGPVASRDVHDNPVVPRKPAFLMAESAFRNFDFASDSRFQDFLDGQAVPPSDAGVQANSHEAMSVARSAVRLGSARDRLACCIFQRTLKRCSS
jgi:hypothetical protein